YHTAIANLESEVGKIWQNGYGAGCIFLEVEGAFDKCSPWATLKEMKAHGVGCSALQCIYCMVEISVSRCFHDGAHAGDGARRSNTPGKHEAFMLSLSDVLSPWAYVTYADDAVVIFQYKTEEE
ncbi:hypothetical protein FOZ63_028207, partial [Perkinsus olseni]